MIQLPERRHFLFTNNYRSTSHISCFSILFVCKIFLHLQPIISLDVLSLYDLFQKHLIHKTFALVSKQFFEIFIRFHAKQQQPFQASCFVELKWKINIISTILC